MPSSFRQILITANKKKGKTKGSIIIMKDTGYRNVTINGRQYYYNRVASYSMTTKDAVKKTVKPKSYSKNRKSSIRIRRLR